MTDRLAGRTVFITAVGDLPGDALVRGFASEGANVAVNHLKPEVAERSAKLARESGVEAVTCSAHLLDRRGARRSRFGGRTLGQARHPGRECHLVPAERPAGEFGPRVGPHRRAEPSGADPR